MEINHTKFTNHTWNSHEMFEEDQVLHDQNPLINTVWPTYPLLQITQQTQTPAASSSQIPISTLLGGGDQTGNGLLDELAEDDEPEEELGAMKEMMFRIAAMQPVDIDPAAIRKPKRRNVRISDDPQSVAARLRRERISEKIRILQRLVPGGRKLDTASMLDEAIRYVKFLKRQIRSLQSNPLSVNGDWQVAYNNKPLGSTTTSSSPLKPRAIGTGFIFGAAGNGSTSEPASFFNHEVIN